MHIPDGFLSVMVAILFWIPSVIVVGIALNRVGKDLGDRQVPLMGVLAAAIFAGQMLNFSVAGGTSGHLLGAALATILLGPWAAVLVLTCVVGVQALFFQDGGLLALGANIFNMAIVGVFVAYPVYRTIRRISGNRPWGIFAGGFISAWASIVTASLACGLQLALSGTSPANLAIPAMGGIHALIGVGEGLITLGALTFLYAAWQDLLKIDNPQPGQNRAVWIGGLALILALAVASPLASQHPDGLQWVAEQQGFSHLQKAAHIALIPDYIIPGIQSQALATILAAVLGSALVLGAAIGISSSRRNRSDR